MDLTFEDATLTFNAIGRHISTMATTRLVCDGSPWLKDVGEDINQGSIQPWGRPIDGQ
jgi:hypothetical protein